MPKTGPKLPLWKMNSGIIEEIKRNCTSSLLDCPLRVIVFLASNIDNPRIIVRFATFEPRTLPTESPPSPSREAIVETESSGSDVVTDRIMNPAAISDIPRALDISSTYRIIRSLTYMISSSDINKTGRL